jgi:hypothetical protein
VADVMPFRLGHNCSEIPFENAFEEKNHHLGKA